MKLLKVKTLLPDNRPSFNEWCAMFKVSSRVLKDSTPIKNAQRIMDLWDGFTNSKTKLALKSGNDIDF